MNDIKDHDDIAGRLERIEGLLATLVGRPTTKQSEAAACDPAEILQAIPRAMRRLDPMERRVIMGRFDGRTFHEIAKDLGVTKERVRQIEESAKRFLRAALMADHSVEG